MPHGDPRFGEIWTTTDGDGRLMQGIVADVTESMVTLVSLTGNRVRFPTTRFGWRFDRNAPAGSPSCVRQHCRNPGFLLYSRGATHEYACPRHLPVSVQAEIVGVVSRQWSESVEPVRDVLPCPNCHDREPVEDYRVGPLIQGLGFWSCMLCSTRWIMIGPPPQQAHASWFQDTLDRVLSQFAQQQYEPTSISLTRAAFQYLPGLEAPQNPEFSRYRDIPIIPPLTQEGVLALIHVRGTLGRPVQRLGGQPNRTVEYRGQSLEPRPRNTPETRLERIVREEPGPAPDDLPPVPVNTTWAARNGDVVEVVRCERSLDGDLVIVFRQAFDGTAPATSLVHRDFVTFHKLLDEKDIQTAAIARADVPIAMGEEWESANGELVNIIFVDHRTSRARGEDKNGKQRTIAFAEIHTKQWRKVMRKTVYERLMQDDF